MDTAQWLEAARAHKDALSYLVDSYHPASFESRDPRYGLSITASNAEAASAVVRQKIRDEDDGVHPVTKLHAALEAGDVGAIMSVLNQAWFGVPESTSCWSIRGFKEAVDLLEDPPEPEDEEVV